jgi:hypothetical protein
LDTDPEDVLGTKEMEEEQRKIGRNDDDEDEKKKKKERRKVMKGQEAVDKLKWIQFKQPSPFGCRADKEKFEELFNSVEMEKEAE